MSVDLHSNGKKSSFSNLINISHCYDLPDLDHAQLDTMTKRRLQDTIQWKHNLQHFKKKK